MKGANPEHGRWGNGVKRDTVKRTGFVENTITSPKARPAPAEESPLLLEISTPWYETSSRVNRIRENPKQRSQTGGTT
jgi:hypothetical protein